MYSTTFNVCRYEYELMEVCSHRSKASIIVAFVNAAWCPTRTMSSADRSHKKWSMINNRKHSNMTMITNEEYLRFFWVQVKYCQIMSNMMTMMVNITLGLSATFLTLWFWSRPETCLSLGHIDYPALTLPQIPISKVFLQSENHQLYHHNLW